MGFSDETTDSIHVLDCWVRLGYTVLNLSYEERCDLAKELGLRCLHGVDVDERFPYSVWRVSGSNADVRYHWIPSPDTSFTLLSTRDGRLYDGEGEQLRHEIWRGMGSATTLTITLRVSNCKTGHRLLKAKNQTPRPWIVRVLSIFVTTHTSTTA